MKGFMRILASVMPMLFNTKSVSSEVFHPMGFASLNFGSGNMDFGSIMYARKRTRRNKSQRRWRDCR